MKAYARNEIVSGIFVTLALGVFALFAFKVGQFDVLQSLRGPALECSADFRDVRSLAAGAPVMVAGLEVGEVASIRIARRRLTAEQREDLVALLGPAAESLEAGMTRQVIEVSFKIRDPELRLDPTTARVSLGQSSLLSQHFLSLDPGFWRNDREPAMQEFSEVVKLQSVEAPSIETMFGRLNTTLDRLDHLLRTVNEDVLSEENVGRVDRLLGNLGSSMEEIRRTLDRDDPEGLHAMLLRPINRLITSADEDLASLRGRAESLIEEGAKLARTANGLAVNTDAMIQDLHPRAKALVDELMSASKNLSRGVAEAQETLTLMQDMLRENRPEIAETLRRMRRSMWEMEMAMRKIRANPAYLLFGDSEPLYDMPASDSSGLMRSGRARPYKQRDEGDDGS